MNITLRWWHRLLSQHSNDGPNSQWRDLLYRSTSSAFLVSVSGAGLGFITHLVLARLIGKAEYGIYALMLSWVSLLATVSQAGQDANVVRFLPTYLISSQWGKVRGLRNGIGLLVLGSSTTIAIIGCIVVHFVGGRRTPEWRETFYIGLAMLPILTQLQQSGAMHRAFKRAVASNAYTVIARPAILLALLAIIVALSAKLDAPIAAGVSAIAALLALALSAWHVTRAWPGAGRHATAEYDISRWARTGMQLSFLSIVMVAGNRLDVLILGGLLGASDVGPYYAAVQIASLTLYAGQAVNVILAPLIAERYDAGDIRGLQAVAYRATRISVLGALATAICAALAGRWLLKAFGPGFETAYVPLLILLTGYCITSGFGEVGFLLSMTRYQAQTSLFVIVGVVANISIEVSLVPHLGPTGAALGAIGSLAVWRGLSLRFAIRHLGVNPAIFHKPLAGEGRPEHERG